MSTETTAACYGISCVGTAVVIDINGFQSWLSIICMIITILGVLIPAVIKLIAKIKKYYADKKLSAEELEDIANDIKQTTDDITEIIKKDEK